MGNRFSVRDFEATDKNLVIVSWLNGYYYGNDKFNKIPNILFFDNYRKTITDILASPLTTIKIACLSDDPDVILGFSVFDKDILHWVFVKKSWRNLGIAKELVPKDIKYCTHVTKSGEALRRKYGVILAPFIK
jgi:GNAT superfamily N-acetyltransferase